VGDMGFGDDENGTQMIKRIVMNRKEQMERGVVVREGDFSKFKVNENKESSNIKKMGN
jgi:hypothetical protein